MSLVRPDALDGQYMDPQFAPRTAPFVWTADLVSEERGWLVNFFFGICDTEKLGFHAHLRAVRADTG